MKYLCLLLALLALGFSIVPRQLAPDFSGLAVLPDNSFTTLKLSDFSGKYLVLLFYPFDFTYVCPTEIISFSDRANDFKKIGAEIIGVSVDSHFSHLAWKNTPREKGGLGQINIPLLADITKRISREYGVLVEDPEDGLNGATLRGLFIIDGKGKIRSITINDEQVGRNVDETIRIIQAFQHADQHGVVCPAGWQPGAKTIIPDQAKSKEYFKGDL